MRGEAEAEAAMIVVVQWYWGTREDSQMGREDRTDQGPEKRSSTEQSTRPQ